jgi:hypothetical protein
VDPSPVITTGNGVIIDSTGEGQGLRGLHEVSSPLF